MIRNLKIFIVMLLLTVLITVSGAGCSLITTTNAPPGSDTIKEAWDIITTGYVDPSKIDTANMTAAAIKGLIDTLEDPYTTYLTPEEFQLTQSSISGQFDGIGAVVSIRDGNLVICHPLQRFARGNTPALRPAISSRRLTANPPKG